MTPLTNDMIIQNLNESSPFMRLEILLYFGLFLIYGIVCFFKFKKEQNSERKKIILTFVILLTLFLGIPIFKACLKYRAIQYSIDNKCFEVMTDTVVRTSSNTDRHGNTTYYVYLTQNGKITVSKTTYWKCTTGDSVYVVIAKGRFGGKYKTGNLYLTSRYKFVDK